MADPLSIAGLAIGGLSFSIQLLQSCLQSFEIFESAVDMPKDCATVSLRLQIEHERLKHWSEVAGLLNCEDETLIRRTVKANRLLLATILSEIQVLMSSFADINGQYIELQSNSDMDTQFNNGEDDESRRTFIEDFSSIKVEYNLATEKKKTGFLSSTKKVLKDTKSILKNPKRLKWVFISAELFEKLLVRLKELIDYLHEIMDDQQIEAIHKTTRNTYLEMLQLRSTVGELKVLMRAIEPLRSSHRLANVGGVGDYSEEDQVIVLAEFKSASFALHTELSKGTLNIAEIKSSALLFDTAKNGNGPISAVLRTGNTDRRVWVEWKEMKEHDEELSFRDTDWLGRVKELAALLSLEKPREFRAPRCIGYIDGREDPNSPALFGMVFEVPQHEGSLDGPVALLKLIQENPKPSLSRRISLASKICTCVFYLHSVNWLHKGLRSQNILCFPGSSGDALEIPYLVGFEYARPARSNEATETTPAAASELYRHPNSQGSEHDRQYYRKTFDIYSLGIILLEIALWKSVQEIMGIADIEKASPVTTFRVRQRLLQEEDGVFLREVEASVGRRYCEAVRACLVGAEALGIEAGDQETSVKTGARLQERFRVEVLDKIGSICV